jgi:hypothetical protein
MILIGAGTGRIEPFDAEAGGGRDDQAHARHGDRLGQWPTDWRDGRARWHGRCCGRFGRSAGDVGGECGQVGVGPRGERPARPRGEFFLRQPAIHERGLQRLDHLLAVGVARPEPVMSRRRVLLSCRHRTPPLHPRCGKRSAAASRRRFWFGSLLNLADASASRPRPRCTSDSSTPDRITAGDASGRHAAPGRLRILSSSTSQGDATI